MDKVKSNYKSQNNLQEAVTHASSLVAHDITEHNKPFSDSEFVKLYGGRS
jgi:hypothetical protein